MTLASLLAACGRLPEVQGSEKQGFGVPTRVVLKITATCLKAATSGKQEMRSSETIWLSLDMIPDAT